MHNKNKKATATYPLMTNDNAGTKTGQNFDRQYECLVAAYTSQLAWFTALLALVTAFLIVVGIYQGVQLKRSVDSTERANEVLERAYLWPGFGLLIEQNGIRFGIHLGICNTGRTA